MYDVWKDIDRSHRKLGLTAAPGRIGVWMSEATVLRVLRQEHLICPEPAAGTGSRADWPDWVAWRPNSTWIQNFTHFSSCSQAAIAVMDVVSRVLADHPGEGWSAR